MKSEVLITVFRKGNNVVTIATVHNSTFEFLSGI